MLSYMLKCVLHFLELPISELKRVSIFTVLHLERLLLETALIEDTFRFIGDNEV